MINCVKPDLSACLLFLQNNLLTGSCKELMNLNQVTGAKLRNKSAETNKSR